MSRLRSPINWTMIFRSDFNMLTRRAGFSRGCAQPKPRSETAMQNARVLHYLQENAAIDAFTASQALGITRLSARIYDLRKEGHAITSERVEVENRFGEVCRVARYKLEKAV